jgi:hypothetical protein
MAALTETGSKDILLLGPFARWKLVVKAEFAIAIIAA